MAGQIEKELQNSKPLVGLEVEVALNIQRTGDFLERWTDDTLQSTGLRGDEYNVLRILRGAGQEGISSTDARSRMVRDTGRFPALLHSLRTKGYIEGMFELKITDTGLALLASLDGMLEQAIRKRIGRIEPHKLRTVVEVMEEMRAAD